MLKICEPQFPDTWQIHQFGVMSCRTALKSQSSRSWLQNSFLFLPTTLLFHYVLKDSIVTDEATGESGKLVSNLTVKSKNLGRRLHSCF